MCQICSIYLYIKKKKHHLWSVFSFSLTAVLQISVIQIFWCPLFSKIWDWRFYTQFYTETRSVFVEHESMDLLDLNW